MINVGENKIVDDEYLKSELDKAAAEFENVKKVKADGYTFSILAKLSSSRLTPAPSKATTTSASFLTTR